MSEFKPPLPVFVEADITHYPQTVDEQASPTSYSTSDFVGFVPYIRTPHTQNPDHHYCSIVIGNVPNHDVLASIYRRDDPKFTGGSSECHFVNRRGAIRTEIPALMAGYSDSDNGDITVSAELETTDKLAIEQVRYSFTSGALALLLAIAKARRQLGQRKYVAGSNPLKLQYTTRDIEAVTKHAYLYTEASPMMFGLLLNTPFDAADAALSSLERRNRG